jgi:hypothetical protein
MAGFNGTGTFERNYNFQDDAANGIDIEAVRMDAEMDEIASALSSVMPRDGQAAATGDWDMGGNNITNLAAPSDGGDAVTLTHWQAGRKLIDANIAAGAQTVLSNISSAAYTGRLMSVGFFNGGSSSYDGGCAFVNARQGGTVKVGSSSNCYCGNDVNWAAVVANYPNQVVVGREATGGTLTIFNNLSVDVAVYLYLL